MTQRVNSVVQAVEVYRESPNTFGHEKNDVPRRRLKLLMGAVASQRYLQDSIHDALASGDFEDISPGIRHLWERLKDNEDDLRDAEKEFGEAIAGRPYMTLPGQVHCVPTMALQIAKVEAAAK